MDAAPPPKAKKIVGRSYRLIDFAIRDDVPYDEQDDAEDDEEDDEDDEDNNDKQSNSSSSSKHGSAAKRKETVFGIQMFGLNERGETCSVYVQDFQPFFYVKGGDNWGHNAAETVLRFLRGKAAVQHRGAVLRAETVQRHKLYGFTGGRTYSFVQVTFANLAAMNNVKRLWRDAVGKPRPVVVGDVPLELYESNIPPLLRFFHIHNLSPSGWFLLRLNAKTIVPRKRRTSCTFEYVTTMANILPQPDKEMRVPYKICSFDIEASSSHGDFPLPVKTYKRLATNLMDVAMRRLPHPIHAKVIKRVILTAFGMEQAENVDRVFPKQMPTKVELKQKVERLLTKSVHEVVEELQNVHTNRVLEIDRMFQKSDIVGIHADDDADDGDDGGGGADDGESSPRNPPRGGGGSSSAKLLTLTEVVNHPKLTRDAKIQIIKDALTHSFPLLEGDQVTYIGSTFLRYGESEPYLNHCVTVGPCDPVEGVVLEHAPTERDLLVQWRDLMVRENPDIVIGYNIFGFDWEFMFQRAQETDCVQEFLTLSRNTEELSATKDYKTGKLQLENTQIVLATGEYDLRYPKLTGRLHIDLYTYFRRDFNLASYKLDDVASSNICDDVLWVRPLEGAMDYDGQDVTELYSRNLTGLHVGDFIHLELSGFTSDYYQNGQKFRVVDLKFNVVHPDVGVSSSTFNVIVISGRLTELVATTAAGKKLKWGVAKDDMSLQDLFRMMKGTLSERALVAKYCVQDCNLVHHLMRKLDVVTGFSEMARICSVPISFLVFRGQGIKLTSFVAKKCREKDTLMPDLEKGSGDDGYEGAIVLPPKTGMYMDNPVACVDYSSLYPSSMISQNYSHDSKVWTKEYDLSGNLVSEWGEKDAAGNFRFDNLPGFQYLDTEFDTYKAIRKTPTSRPEKTMVGKKMVRWAQLPGGQKSIMPSILEELLSARKKTRKAAEAESDPFMSNILDKRQLGYKVTANSLYGQCGARTSTFYEQDVAASTTATGRSMIMYAKHMVEDVYGHRVVAVPKYGSTVLCKAEYVYGDSVAGWTPVYVRTLVHSGDFKLDILTVEELAKKYGGNCWIPMTDRHHTATTKECCELGAGVVESWSESGWTRVHRVIRHRLASHKSMVRVQTKYGVVDVTDDHSLLRAHDASEISPRDVVVGQTPLLHMALPRHALPERSKEDWEYFDYDYDDDDQSVMDFLDMPFLSQSTQWTFRNARDFERYNPMATICMSASTQLECAHLMWLAECHGWLYCHVSWIPATKEQEEEAEEDDEEYMGGVGQYQILVRKSRPRVRHPSEAPQVVQSMTPWLDFPAGEHVYDLTTDNHHFSAGAGSLVVHNTDSVFFTFNLENPETGDKIRGQSALELTIEIAQEVAKLCTHFLKPPMELSYEKTLMPFVLLSKKRYVGMLYETNATKGKLKYMGLSLKRRDSCDYLKDVYGGILTILMKERDVEKAVAYLDEALETLSRGQVSMDKLMVTKALRSDYKNPMQIGHWVLAERMGQRDPGNKPKPGDRMRFVVVQLPPAAGKKPLMGDRIETPEFIVANGLTVDYAHYITNQLMKPLQQLFGLALVPLWESRKKGVSITSYEREMAKLEREHGDNLEVFAKKKEKYCADKVKTLIFEKHLVNIRNEHQRLQNITTFFPVGK